MAAGKKGGRRRRSSAAVALAGLAVAAVALGAFARFDGTEVPASAHKHVTRPSQSGGGPWDLKLTPAGTKTAGQPQCSYGAGRLYCVRPGALAVAVDAADGKLLWSRPDPGWRKGDVPGSPVLSGGLLQVLSRGGQRLTALDPSTGKTRWERDTTRYKGGVAQAGGVVLLTGGDSEVTALDATTGKQMWRHPLPGLSAPRFSSYGGDVAYAVSSVGSRTRVAAIDPETGAVAWKRDLDRNLNLVHARAGLLWFTSTDTHQYTDAVVRYDVARRTVKRVELPVPLPGAQAVVRGDTAYLLADGGALVAVSTRSSAQLWRLETSVSWSSAPTVAGDRLYLSAGDGRLLAVDTAHGTLLGQTKARLGGNRGSLVTALPSPLVSGTRVYATAPDGVLFAVDGRDPSGW